MWERACSRMRFIIQHSCWLTHRFREQVESSHRRSHIDRVSTFRIEEASWIGCPTSPSPPSSKKTAVS
ncbi:hypothetical protein C5612_18110 [Pseudomonas frederiksbergensis]|uniref:Uncharacterized protein n=1 Tax=Pseudomonas frederiksbergensis TaxID=104087 RepID=A0A2S8HJX7_9PSED|nr:hypothetical protein C5612_18110 [Pseudomonas frederiksbergensis]